MIEIWINPHVVKCGAGFPHGWMFRERDGDREGRAARGQLPLMLWQPFLQD